MFVKKTRDKTRGIVSLQFPENKMSKKSSRRWLRRQRTDHYVAKANANNYRSRASFKLIELNQKHNFLKPNIKVLDLGAAPGGWSQVVAEKCKDNSKIIALDILTIEPIDNVTFLQGDFTDTEVQLQLTKILNNSKIDLVISDLAPNISGIKAVDQVKSIYLNELALSFAQDNLSIGGSFICKVFQGEGCSEFIKMVRQSFNSVKNRKPKASRSESREVFVVATDFNGK